MKRITATPGHHLLLQHINQSVEGLKTDLGGWLYRDYFTCQPDWESNPRHSKWPF